MSENRTGRAVPSEVNHRKSIDEHLCVMLRLAHQRANAIMLEAIRPSGLTTIQYYALWKIHESEPISQNRLGRHLGMDPATSQGVSLRLERRGLISRSPHPSDGRRLELRVTPEGVALLESLGKSPWEAEAAFLDEFTQGERAVFSRLIQRLAHAA